jgi:hypothetical protein
MAASKLAADRCQFCLFHVENHYTAEEKKLGLILVHRQLGSILVSFLSEILVSGYGFSFSFGSGFDRNGYKVF